jgi:plastocyanin domain-containing protein
MKAAAFLVLLAACGGGNDQIPPPAKPTAAPAPAATPAPAPTGGRRIELTVTENGFEPTPIEVVAGQQVTLVVTRTIDNTCAREIVIKDHGIEAKLPLGKPVAIAFTPKKSGELIYGCGMDQMIRGVLLVR